MHFQALGELSPGARNQWVSCGGFCFVFVFNENGGFLSWLSEEHVHSIVLKAVLRGCWAPTVQVEKLHKACSVISGLAHWTRFNQGFNQMLISEPGNMNTTSAYWNRQCLKQPEKRVD